MLPKYKSLYTMYYRSSTLSPASALKRYTQPHTRDKWESFLACLQNQKMIHIQGCYANRKGSHILGTIHSILHTYIEQYFTVDSAFIFRSSRSQWLQAASFQIMISIFHLIFNYLTSPLKATIYDMLMCKYTPARNYPEFKVWQPDDYQLHKLDLWPPLL